MKKLVLALAVVFSVALVSCGNKEAKTADSDSNVVDSTATEQVVDTNVADSPVVDSPVVDSPAA